MIAPSKARYHEKNLSCAARLHGLWLPRTDSELPSGNLHHSWKYSRVALPSKFHATLQHLRGSAKRGHLAFDDIQLLASALCHR